MSTVKHFKCDFCGRTKTDPDDVHGLTWTHGGTDLGERNPGQVLAHLCKVCMSAIKRVPINQGAVLEDESPEPPVETETTEEPDAKQHDGDGIPVEVGRLYWIEIDTLRDRWRQVEAVEMVQTGVMVSTTPQDPFRSPWAVAPERLRRHHPGEVGSSVKPEEPGKPPETDCEECPAVQVLAAELAEANRTLEAQATAPQGVLQWEHPRLGLFHAESASSDAHYGVSCDGGTWFALSRGIEIRQGTVYECLVACERLEAEPDEPPTRSTG